MGLIFEARWMSLEAGCDSSLEPESPFIEKERLFGSSNIHDKTLTARSEPPGWLFFVRGKPNN
jgi:hypothetical protein